MPPRLPSPTIRYPLMPHAHPNRTHQTPFISLQTNYLVPHYRLSPKPNYRLPKYRLWIVS
jgi:hypothetical protein